MRYGISQAIINQYDDSIAIFSILLQKKIPRWSSPRWYIVNMEAIIPKWLEYGLFISNNSSILNALLIADTTHNRTRNKIAQS